MRVQRTGTYDSLERESGMENDSYLGKSTNDPNYDSCYFLSPCFVLGALYTYLLILTTSTTSKFLFANVAPEALGELSDMGHITHEGTVDGAKI